MVGVVPQHFRTDVLHSPAEGASFTGLMDAPSEVTDFGVVVRIQKDVLQLEVAMHHIPLVKVGESLRNLKHY